MNRRTFLAASAALASQARPILGANERVNLAVVGVGGRGRQHIGFFNDVPDSRIVAVCDVNQSARERAEAMVSKLQGHKPKTYRDMRELFEDPDVDAVTVATPNHWHALTTIWACQAGKDVYCEKPATHNVFESRQMVAAARKYDRVVQIGSQSRSIAHKIKAIGLLREGVIGDVYMARGLCYRRRNSIGRTPEEQPPPGVDWDFFLGPAPMRPYTKNRFDYNWHWFWDTGTGDIGNQGVHEMDICRWGLGVEEPPRSVVSTGGKYVWDDDQETANTQQASFDYGDKEIVFEVRNLNTGTEADLFMDKSVVGNIFFGSKGFMTLDPEGFRVFLGDARELAVEEKKVEELTWDPRPHMRNFVEAVRKRDPKALNADVEIGAKSVNLCHWANASLRLGRTLAIDPATGLVPLDAEANAILSRDYREPYVVPRRV